MIRPAMPLITLTTDFGTQDGYVGAMKGVIFSLAAAVRIVDITHDVAAHDISAAAFALAQSAPYFPDGTIHVAVVDPGVGGRRRGVVIDDGRHLYVGPDNGVFSLVAPAPRAVHEIALAHFRRPDVSATFHGRDVFAVAAARLASGSLPQEAGPRVTLEGKLAGAAVPSAKKGEVAGQVVHIDRFGNLITDIQARRLPAQGTVQFGRLKLPRLSRVFEDVPVGKPLAYVGSAGVLEIAVREGSAASVYGVKRGAPVVVRKPAK
jgi:S-adenosyl-L-methionine hydrolase (adenosine-forming)